MKKKIILIVMILLFTLCSISLAQKVGERWPENFDFMLGDYSVEIEEHLNTDIGIIFSFKNVLLDDVNVCLVGEVIIPPAMIVESISLTAVVFNEDKIILKILDIIDIKPDENVIKFKHAYPFTTDYRYIVFSTIIRVKREKEKSKSEGV